MLTVISTILAALAGILPALVDVWNKKLDLQHEKELLNLRLEAAARGMEFQLHLEDAKASYLEGESLRRHDSTLRGGKFIETLRASIRPVITYLFFALFVVVEISAAYVMIKTGYDVPTMLAAIWNSETTAIFGAIMGFWFGSRTMEKMLYGPPDIGGRRRMEYGPVIRPRQRDRE